MGVSVSNISKSDKIITAYAEYCSGPGWVNNIVSVLVQDSDGALRLETLQPDEQTPRMRALFSVSEVSSWSMTSAVREAVLKTQ